MPAKHDLMRNTNALSILNNIRTAGRTTRRAVQFATGLGWATVSTITSELISSGVLTELENTEKVPGRTPAVLDFAPDSNLCIGVEINIEGINVVLLDLRCEVITEKLEPLEKAEKTAVLKQMFRMIDSVLIEKDLTPESLLGFGVAVQGSVDGKGQNSLYNPYIEGWRDVPITDILKERYGKPALVQHDPLCIALYEQWDKNYTQDHDLILVRLAFGIGMGYVHGGHEVSGYQGTAGELGHMVLNPEGPECICGNRGCLESYCSVRGIARRAFDALGEKSGLLEFPDSDINLMNKLFYTAAAMARDGDAAMKAIFDEAGFYLGVGIANLVNILNPRSILICGSFCDAQDLFFGMAKEVAKQRSWPLSQYQISVIDSRKDAAKGAALQIINRAFSSQDSPLLG